MQTRERQLDSAAATVLLVVALAIAHFVPSQREVQPWLIPVLVLAYAAVLQVRFEFAEVYNSPVQLVLVAMWVLLPLPLIPLLVAGGAVLQAFPAVLRRKWHRDRWITPLGEAWYTVGPVLVLTVLAPHTPSLYDAPVYVLAFLAQVGGDLAWGLLRDRELLGMTSREIIRSCVSTAQVDAILAPLGFVIAVAAVDTPAVLVVLAPLVWLLHFFSRDREARYSASLELNRAYRGVVMLLADVVEFDDSYTANHSRSVVDMVRAVAEELGIEPAARQELEFAALLHDVGKIGIPKEILNKPAALSDEEFEVMKTHTIEGQFMLDRVGGLLGRVGEIVRSCHERWDGYGYPDGLKGAAIPLAARIVFVCDAFSAMTTDRPYRAAMSTDAALSELRSNAGTQFDPRVVAAFAMVSGQLHVETPPSTQIRALLSATSRGSAEATSY
jgi:HD-GYP domain-containing protein (c-di-GMP phosphodiesterase class II)